MLKNIITVCVFLALIVFSPIIIVIMGIYCAIRQEEHERKEKRQRTKPHKKYN